MASISLPLALTLLLTCLPLVLGRSVAEFTLELSWGRRAPDGFERGMILVNGDFPGPTLEMNEGDDVVVEVINGLDDEATIHFHGIEMIDTPWSDGTPGLSQRAIPPGQNFTYRWKALQHGSYWYHSHSHEQVEDGLYGALTIHPSPKSPKPFGLISKSDSTVKAMERAEKDAHNILMSDHRHITAAEAWEFTQIAGYDPMCWDSILINGKGRVRCMEPGEAEELLTEDQRKFLAEMNATLTDKGCWPPQLMATAFGTDGTAFMMPTYVLRGCNETDAPLEVIKVCRDETYGDDSWVALNLIGAFHGISATISIDEHPMWVYAVDGGYVRPRRVEAVPITNGERFSVLIQAKKAGDFTIRVAASTDPQIIAGYATLRVDIPGQKADKGPSVPYINDAGEPLSRDVEVYDPNTSKPYPPKPIPEIADETLILHMGTAIPPYLWALNVTPLAPPTLEAEAPLLLEPRPSRDHIVGTRKDEWVDIVLITATSPNPPHPIHKHGVKMYLLGMGYGPWTHASIADAAADMPGAFNLVDPPFKDSFTSLKVGFGNLNDTAWLAVRYHANNPGAWLLHCHVLGHLIGGMQVVLLDGVDDWPEMPEEYRELAERRHE